MSDQKDNDDHDHDAGQPDDGTADGAQQPADDGGSEGVDGCEQPGVPRPAGSDGAAMPFPKFDVPQAGQSDAISDGKQEWMRVAAERLIAAYRGGVLGNVTRIFGQDRSPNPEGGVCQLDLTFEEICTVFDALVFSTFSLRIDHSIRADGRPEYN